MPAPFRIRPAAPADGPGIAFVRVTTWRAAYRGIVPQDYLDQMDIIEESKRWSEGLSRLDSNVCAFVAEVEPPDAGEPARPRIAGYAFGGPVREEVPGHTSELYAIYVLPEHQGQGMGRELFRAVTGWLAGWGHGGMIVYVLRDNLPSRRFYEAQGGRLLREQMVDTGGVMLAEVGYGYNLPALDHR